MDTAFLPKSLQDLPVIGGDWSVDQEIAVLKHYSQVPLLNGGTLTL